MKWSTKHYARLDRQTSRTGQNLLAAQSWDSLRVDEHHRDYSIPTDRSTWVKRCARDQTIVERSSAIVALMAGLGVTKVFSAGSGRACLEYNIKRVDPSLYVACSDYAPRSVRALREHFVECDDVRQFDMSTDDWPTGVDLYLLHRVDTHLKDAEWHVAFERMRLAAVRYVLITPDVILSMPRWVRERVKELLHVAGDKRMVFDGYVRTVDSLSALWSETHDLAQTLVLGGLRSFLLERKA